MIDKNVESKIAILSDLHLGKNMFVDKIGDRNAIEKVIEDNFKKRINEILWTNEIYGVDYVFILGDIFDVPNPSIRDINIFIRGIKRLCENNIGVEIISGNHDYNRTDEYAQVFEIIENTFKNYECVTVTYSDFKYSFLQYQNVLFYFVPFFDYTLCRYGEYPKIYDKIGISMDKYWNTIIHDVKNKSDYAKETYGSSYNVLLAHAIIESDYEEMLNYSNQREEFIGIYSRADFDYEDKVKDINKYRINTGKMIIPDRVMENFDLAVLGHIHNTSDFERTKGNGGTYRRISNGSNLGERAKIDSDYGTYYLNIKFNEDCVPTIETEIHEIDLPKFYRFETTNKEELNSYLESIRDYSIYNISYAGNWYDIDNEAFRNAKSKALHLHINVYDNILTEEFKDMSNSGGLEFEHFWGWVKENKNEYYKEFKDTLENKI